MKRFLILALSSILIISSLAAAASTFTIWHFKTNGMTEVRLLDEHNLAETKEHMERANRLSLWLHSHQPLLMRTFYIGSVISAITGLMLIFPVLLLLRTSRIPARLNKYLVSALVGILMACSSYVLWVSTSHEIQSIDRHLDKLLPDIVEVSELTPDDTVSELLLKMESLSQQLQTSLAVQIYSLLFFSIGIGLWPIGIVPLVIFRNKYK